MHPLILLRYIFNILYNVIIGPIVYDIFSTNDDEYLKLIDGLTDTTFEVSKLSILSSSQKAHDIPFILYTSSSK